MFKKNWNVQFVSNNLFLLDSFRVFTLFVLLRVLKVLCKNKKEGDKVSCPICRRVAVVPKDGLFPLNFFAQNIAQLLSPTDQTMTASIRKCHKCEDDAEDNEAASFCKECEGGEGVYLCPFHSEAHKRSKKTKTHSLQVLTKSPGKFTKRQGDQVCSIHPKKKIKLLCYSCNQLICQGCALTTHKDHKYEFVDVIAEKEKQELKCKVEDVHRFTSKVQHSIQQIERTQKALNSNVEDAKRSIDQHANKLIAQIKQMKQQLEVEVENIGKQKRQVLQQQQDQLTQILLQANKLVEAVQKSISEGSPAQVMQAKQQWEQTEHQVKIMMENSALEVMEDEYVEFIAGEGAMKTLGSVHGESMTAADVRIEVKERKGQQVVVQIVASRTKQSRCGKSQSRMEDGKTRKERSEDDKRELSSGQSGSGSDGRGSDGSDSEGKTCSKQSNDNHTDESGSIVGRTEKTQHD